jgi:hypothetical protein
LANLAKIGTDSLGYATAELLGELTYGCVLRILAGLVLTLCHRPGVLIPLPPKRASWMNEQHFDRPIRKDPVRKNSSTQLRHGVRFPRRLASRIDDTLAKFLASRGGIFQPGPQGLQALIPPCPDLNQPRRRILQVAGHHPVLDVTAMTFGIEKACPGQRGQVLHDRLAADGIVRCELRGSKGTSL